MSRMKHCTLQSDMGFKQISLELYGVHNSENDSYMNLIIHLLYHSDTTRPHKVEINTINGNKLNDDIKQKLKTYFKQFKISDLQTAFDEILSENNSTFTWMQEDDTESPLELNVWHLDIKIFERFWFMIKKYFNNFIFRILATLMRKTS